MDKLEPLEIFDPDRKTPMSAHALILAGRTSIRQYSRGMVKNFTWEKGFWQYQKREEDVIKQ